MAHDPTEDAVQAVIAIIRMATPKESYRGKQSRNKLVKAISSACRTMSHDKRLKEWAQPI